MELVRVSARQGPERPSWGDPWAGERCRRDEAGVRPVDADRAGRRHRYDDPGAGPSHAPPTEASRVLEDFHRRLEVVLQGVPEGMWMQIQDEGVLEQCVGGQAELWTLIHRAAVAATTMTGRLPPGPGGPPAGGAPPPDRGPGGGALAAP
jgi:hypothetical protein